MAFLAVCLGGCLQLEINISLQPDGGAVITERLQFSRALLDLDDAKSPQLEPLLARSGAEERMQSMGPGVTLESHKVQEGERASRESIAVFRVADLDKFTYVSPFLPTDGAEHSVALKTTFHAPVRDGSSWEYLAGWVGVQFTPVADPRAKRRAPLTQPEPPPPPIDMQMFRELRPVVGDLLRQFRLKVTFESYAPVLRASFGWRNAASATRIVDLIDFAPDQNNDMFGASWLENEEIMLDMVRLRMDSPVVRDHLKGWTNNPTLPAVHHWGNIYFRPSMPLFKRFFLNADGTPKSLYHHRTGDTPAKFEEIGYQPDKAGSKPEVVPPVTPPAATSQPVDHTGGSPVTPPRRNPPRTRPVRTPASKPATGADDEATG